MYLRCHYSYKKWTLDDFERTALNYSVARPEIFLPASVAYFAYTKSRLFYEVLNGQALFCYFLFFYCPPLQSRGTNTVSR
jgi:hypothetical protein